MVLENLTDAELLNMAHALSLTVPPGTTREELIEMLKGNCGKCTEKKGKVEVVIKNLPTFGGVQSVVKKKEDKDCVPCLQNKK